MELSHIASLARETSIGNALWDFGFNLFDLKADPVGHIRLSLMLDEVDLQDLVDQWSEFLVTGVSAMRLSDK
jgi:hypothetical protein